MKLVEFRKNCQNIGYVAMPVFVLVKLWWIHYPVCVALRQCFTIVGKTAIVMNQPLKILRMLLIDHVLATGSTHVLGGVLWEL